MKRLKDLDHIMYENYNEEELLKVYKLKLISLKNTKENETLINYYKNEIIRLSNIIKQKELQGKTK